MAAVERAIAVLTAVLPDAPGARLHLTHLSTAGALDAVRRAKAAGLPVTCDVTPHHLGLHGRVGRRRAPLGLGGDGRTTGGRATRGPTARSWRTRTPPPARSTRRCGRRRTRPPCLAALVDGTADAVATDHAPHTQVDKEAEFGLAANGISGVETALGVLLAAVGARRLTLARRSRR